MPKISVIMAVYNGSRYIEEAIQSVLAQTEQSFELIVVDDGSTDESGLIIKRLAEQSPRLKYAPRAHQGLIASLNYGLSIATGEYVARMDADDVSLPERFAKQLAVLEADESIAVCGSWANEIDEKSQIKGLISYPPESTKEIRTYVLMHNPFIHPSVMIRRSVLSDVGGYRKFWKYVEDYELWTRILKKHEAMNIPQPLINYRIHSGQVTRTKKLKMIGMACLVRAVAFFRTVF